jgi:hypothetical protein
MTTEYWIEAKSTTDGYWYILGSERNRTLDWVEHIANSYRQTFPHIEIRVRAAGWTPTEPGPSDPWNNADCRG